MLIVFRFYVALNEFNLRYFISEWKDKLKLAERSMDKICDLNDEV